MEIVYRMAALGLVALNEEVVYRRRAAGNIPWNWNMGVSSPVLLSVQENCR